MIAETALVILFIYIFARQVRRINPTLRAVLWFALLVHFCVIVSAHYWAVQQNTSGVVFDASVDARKYYSVAKRLAERPLWSIKPTDVTRVSGSAWHVGYYYLCIVSIKLSSDPMLLARIFKTALFFSALALTARIWQSLYGIRAALFGIAYLSFGWWEIVYYNFRNIRDGMMASICIFIYALLLREMSWLESGEKMARKGRNKSWLFIGALLMCLSFFRIYLAIAIVLGIVVHFVMTLGISVLRRMIAMSAIGACAIGAMALDRALTYGSGIFERQMATLNFGEVAYGVAKAVLAPIPWQYSQSYLVPSQFIYLVILFIGSWFLVFRIRPKPWWQIATALIMFFFMGIMLESSRARKRMPLVPIVASWCVAGVAAKRIGYPSKKPHTCSPGNETHTSRPNRGPVLAKGRKFDRCGL